MNVPGTSRSIVEEGDVRKQMIEQIEAEYEQTKKEN